MSQKKASGPSIKKPAPAASTGAAETSNSPPKTVAFDQTRLENFVLGRITLGEMEGIGKDLQYEIAKKGYRVLGEGKLEMAKAIFKGLLALDPYDSYFHTAYAAALQREGKYPEAEHAYTLALKFNPYNTTALANRGEVRFQMGRILESADDIKKAIENDPQGKDQATLRARVLSMAISEVIKDNQELILDELKKAQAARKPAGKVPAGKVQSGKAASAKVAPGRPGAKAPAKAPAKKK